MTYGEVRVLHFGSVWLAKCSFLVHVIGEKRGPYQTTPKLYVEEGNAIKNQ